MAGGTNSCLILQDRITWDRCFRQTGLLLSDSLLPASNGRLAALLAALCLFAYAPALNNGFISDDYLMLELVRVWKEDFSYLFKIAPDVFRITSYALLWVLEGIFGYRPEYFYAFSISVHFVNSVLLWKVLSLVTRSSRVSALAAVIFAVFQNPQEAVMWLAAIGDALAGLCVLGALLSWLRKRFVISALCYLAGLFSKESAIVVLFLLPLIEVYMTRQLRFRREHLYLLAPTLIFSAVFIYSLSANYMVSDGVYALGPQTLPVLGISLHRLMFPWLYVGVLAFVIAHRRWLPRETGTGLAWMTVSLLPFVLLTYQSHVPSRHEYLASMGLAWSLSTLLANMSPAPLRLGFILAFVSINIGYLWTVKDAQFEQRAAPTTRLLEQLRAHRPVSLLVLDFPINPWMAPTTARLVPGWRPDMIRVTEPLDACLDCLKLRWNRARENFELVSGEEPLAERPVSASTASH
jgi:hypothetical protein